LNDDPSSPRCADTPGAAHASRALPHVPARAILLVVGAVACFALLDTCVKFLVRTYPVPVIVFVRYLVQALALIVWAGPALRLGLFRTAQPGLQIVRGTLIWISSICFSTALRWMPLADATAINFGTPILVVLLAVVFLNERMTPARWAFVAVGFVGMLLIVRPGASIFQGAALLVLLGAALYGAFQVMTRKLRREDPRVTLFYPALCGTTLMGLGLPFVEHDFEWSWPHALLLVIGCLFGTVGHFMLILAFQRAPASAITPFTYMQLVFATALGFAVFGDFPDAFTLAGMAIISGSGLLLAWFERRRVPPVPD
jgi:drug/metabolite transporter (DMT)-like permease